MDLSWHSASSLQESMMVTSAEAVSICDKEHFAVIMRGHAEGDLGYTIPKFTITIIEPST
jgi:hypothetical protein